MRSTLNPLGLGFQARVSQSYGYLSRGPDQKGYSILGFIKGSPYLWTPPYKAFNASPISLNPL